MRALIADDDRVSAALLARALQQWDVQSVVVHDGAAAWAVLQSPAPPPLVVLDWMMPGLDGPELCRRVRREQSLRHLYVLLVTARDSRADLVAGLDAGADDYLIKPFDPEELRARVHVGKRVLAVQEQLNEQVVELQRAMSQVKQLHGLLPICSYCKKIRNDQDYWEQVDTYITEHSDARFSHGICPACFPAVMASVSA